MSRRRGAQETGGPIGSHADGGGPPQCPRWVFPAVAGGLTAVWLVMNLPRLADEQGEDLPYTNKRAGWPDEFVRWSVSKDTGKTTYSSAFSKGALLFDLVTLAAPIVVAWVITRHLRAAPDRAAARHGGARAPAPSHDAPPSHGPHGGAQVTEGWG